jgi:hypothetical protein
MILSIMQSTSEVVKPLALALAAPDGHCRVIDGGSLRQDHTQTARAEGLSGGLLRNQRFSKVQF